MEQETKMSPHVWIYPDRNSKRDNDEGLWGGGVEGEDETRDRWWAGSGRNIVRSWAQCFLSLLFSEATPSILGRS